MTNLKDYIKLLQDLNISECINLREYLTKRIWRLKHLKNSESSIDDLDLFVRAYNVLKANNLRKVKDVIEFGVENIGLLRNAGPDTANEIMRKLNIINKLQR